MRACAVTLTAAGPLAGSEYCDLGFRGVEPWYGRTDARRGTLGHHEVTARI